jgi:hypothetical protein
LFFDQRQSGITNWHRFKPTGNQRGSNNVSVLLSPYCSVDSVKGRH